MHSKSLQISSALVPKFKLIWANPEDRNTIKQYVIDGVHFHFDQNRNLSSSNLQTNSEDEDEFSVFPIMKSQLSILISKLWLLIIYQILALRYHLI